jgi:hypothetical protein
MRAVVRTRREIVGREMCKRGGRWMRWEERMEYLLKMERKF